MIKQKILMVAAENDALPGAKVGGVGDVLRDLPKALIEQGCQVQTVIPSYGFLSRLEGLIKLDTIPVPFGMGVYDVEVLFRHGSNGDADAFILHHELFYPQGETVYCHDSDEGPFATDASKFAFFSSAVATALLNGVIAKPDVLHCHDWHSAFLLILLRVVPSFSSLSSIHTVYSIHNLAMQGVRPLRGDSSSFEMWFPYIRVDPRDIADPRNPHCINPMRAGIRIADKVHTVSPSYAEEILSPSDIGQGIYGGEGLEADLRVRKDQGDLIGILNGCDYPAAKPWQAVKRKQASLIKLFLKNVRLWAASERELLSAHWIADKQLTSWAAKRKETPMLITSVGRVTEQKARLLVTEVAPGVTALSAMLKALGADGKFVMLGSGDHGLEQALVKESAQHDNFIFLVGFSPEVANTLYAQGDLFIMPSSFEPCGISQLLAMRDGQPCLVNAVGGLRDTIKPDETGLCFEGENAKAQAQAMVEAFKNATELFKSDRPAWDDMCKAAHQERFTWDVASVEYIKQLYC